jgi:hypothetical protein
MGLPQLQPDNGNFEFCVYRGFALRLMTEAEKLRSCRLSEPAHIMTGRRDVLDVIFT